MLIYSFHNNAPLPLVFSHQYFANVITMLNSKSTDSNGWKNSKFASPGLTAEHLSSQMCSKPGIKFANKNAY